MLSILNWCLCSSRMRQALIRILEIGLPIRLPTWTQWYVWTVGVSLLDSNGRLSVQRRHDVRQGPEQLERVFSRKRSVHGTQLVAFVCRQALLPLVS